MTKERLLELQTEIARLKEIDKQTSDRVRASYSINDEGQCIIKEDEIEVPCSAELDMEMANESENIQ